MEEPGLANQILIRLETLKGMRSNFDELWREVRQVVWPEGGTFRETFHPGEKRTRDIYEMTAALALEKFAAAMESFLTSRHTRWHRLVASNEDLNREPEVKEWMEFATDALFRMRNAPGARFYGQAHENYKSLGAYGNGCLYLAENPAGGVRYKYNHIGQTWIETNFDGIVDTVYYEYELTAKAAVQRWGDDAPKSAKSAIAASPFTKHKYVHCVRPRDNVDPERMDAMGMPFESYEVACVDRQIIEHGGFPELPYMWSRYTLNPSEMYGRGPAMLVLPDIQTLQLMEKVFLRSGHKVADPPLLLMDDGVLGRGERRVRIDPGGMTMGGLDTNGRPIIQPLQTGARLDLIKEMMDLKRETIKDAFLVNLFDLLTQDRVQMTATEVLERAKEKGQLLTPVIGRQQSEMLGPMIQRELGIAQRQMILPPMPQALIEAEGEYEIEYESNATRMQKSDEVSGFQRLMEVVMPLVETDPTLMAVFNGEEAVRQYADILGVTTAVLNDDSTFKKIRQATMDAQRQENQLDEAEQMGGTVRNIASAQKDLTA